MSKRKQWDTWGQSSSSLEAHVNDFGDDGSRFCFVSHSGAHKHFAELLCRKLEACGCSAFFDRESDSPAKGEASGAATLRRAAACRLGILLLSEDFFTASKWPMMEFVELLQKRRRTGTDGATEAKILPVFFRLSITNLMLTHSRIGRPVWSHTHWEPWARVDPRVNLKAWENAWQKIVLFDAIHICLPLEQIRLAQRHALRHAQKMIDDDEGRRMIVAKVLSDPNYGFAGPHPAPSIPRAAPQSVMSLDTVTEPSPHNVLSLDSPSIVLQLATAASVIPRAAPTIPRAVPAIPLTLSVIPHSAPVSLYSKGECSQPVIKTVTTTYTDHDSDKDDGSDKDDHGGSDKGIENEESSPDNETMPSDKDRHDSDDESVEYEEGDDDGVQSENEEDEDGAEDDDDYDAASEDGDDDDNNTDSGSDGDNSG